MSCSAAGACGKTGNGRLDAIGVGSAMTLDGASHPEPATGATLATLLQGDAVDWDVLKDRYGPMLALVRVLLGVIPNCDRYLAIWEPASGRTTSGSPTSSTSQCPCSASVVLRRTWWAWGRT